MGDEATTLAAFGYELGVLKRLRHAGWWHAGVRDPDAEHSMRAAQSAAIIAAEEGADPAGRRSSRCGTTARRRGPATYRTPSRVIWPNLSRAGSPLAQD